jgi:Zn/Cd-binding protein ZinT
MFTNKDKKLFSKGGKATHAKYGSEYMKMLGRKGGKKGGRPRKTLSTGSDLQDNASVV